MKYETLIKPHQYESSSSLINTDPSNVINTDRRCVESVTRNIQIIRHMLSDYETLLILSQNNKKQKEETTSSFFL